MTYLSTWLANYFLINSRNRVVQRPRKPRPPRTLLFVSLITIELWFFLSDEFRKQGYLFVVIVVVVSFSSETHRITQMDDSSWLLANINQTGYFRVNYDLQNWRLLIQQLHDKPQVQRCGFSSSVEPWLCSFSNALLCHFLCRSSQWETGRDLLMMPSTWPGEFCFSHFSISGAPGMTLPHSLLPVLMGKIINFR